MINRALFLAFVALLSQSISAQSLEAIEEQQQLDQAKTALHKLDESADAILRGATARKYPCMKSFGHEGFCTCVSEQLSVWVSFRDYLSVTTSSQEQRNAPNIDEETKQTFKHIIKVRNQCVSKAFGQP